MAVAWYNNLSGGINHKAVSLLRDEEAEMLVNVTQDQIGNWAHRLGDDKFLDSVDANDPVRGLHEFRKNDGTTYLHMVCAGTLYVNGVSTWTSQDATNWNTASEINMTNFIGRHYMASSTTGEYVQWATESGSTTFLKAFTGVASASSTGSTLVMNDDVFGEGSVGFTLFNTTDGTSRTITGYTDENTVTVDTAINDTWDGDTIELRIYGKYLATNGAYMMISGNDVYPRRSYYTGVEAETVNVATDYFVTSEPPTGVASFGNGRAFVIYTSNNYLVVDPASVYTNEVEGFGCVSHRSIQNVRGLLIWFSGETFYMLSPNASYPKEISVLIRNDLGNEALMNNIDPANWSLSASGVDESKYYCAVRDLTGTVYGVTLESCVLEFDTNTEGWRVHTHTANDLGNVFATFKNTNGVNLYGGSFTDGTVYRMNTPGLYTDDNVSGTPQTVTATIQTKHYEFIDKGDQVPLMKNVKKLHFKYRGAANSTISLSLNGSETYSGTYTLPLFTTTRWDWNFINLGSECKSISMKFTNTGEFTIYAIGFDLESTTGTGIDGV